MQLVVHIGRHKSGTSAIQRTLSANYLELRAHGILYPRAGRGSTIAHHQLANRVKAGDDIAIKDFRDNLLLEIDGDTRYVIISSEAFQNISSPENIAVFFNSLQFKDIKVICYVREKLDYAISAYRQRIQNRPEFITFRDSLRRSVNARKFIDLWLPCGTFLLYWYNRNDLYNEDIVDDFFMRLSLHEVLKNLKRSRVNANPSIGGNLLYFKLVANRYSLEFLGYSAMASVALSFQQFRESFFVSRELAEMIRANNDYNAVFADLIGLPSLKSWENEKLVPNSGTMNSDMATLNEFGKINPQILSYANLHQHDKWIT